MLNENVYPQINFSNLSVHLNFFFYYLEFDVCNKLKKFEQIAKSCTFLYDYKRQQVNEQVRVS